MNLNSEEQLLIDILTLSNELNKEDIKVKEIHKGHFFICSFHEYYNGIIDVINFINEYVIIETMIACDVVGISIIPKTYPHRDSDCSR